jgi:putative addiction module antidote
MHYSLKITTVGNSTGLILPKEVLAKLGAKKGDTLVLTESPDGFRITAHDPEFVRAMEAYDRVSRRYRNALRELAK